jgi:hypothetical protein
MRQPSKLGISSYEIRLIITLVIIAEKQNGNIVDAVIPIGPCNLSSRSRNAIIASITVVPGFQI